MAAWLDNVKFNPTAGGTTDWTYSTTVTNYQSPSAAGVVNGTKYKYFALDTVANVWEIGEGAYNTGTGVLLRTTVLYNSSGTGTASGQSGAGTKINFANTPIVTIIGIKEDLISIEEANSFTATQQRQARSNIWAAGFGFVNKLRNSSLTSWFHGSSAITITTSGGWGAEGIYIVPTGASVTAQQNTNGLANPLTFWSQKITGAASVTDVTVRFVIESHDAAPLAGQQVTFQVPVLNNTGATITPTITVKRANTQDATYTNTDVSAVSLQSIANGATGVLAYCWAANANSFNGLSIDIDFGNNFSTNGKSIQIGGGFDCRATPGVATGLVSTPADPEIPTAAVDTLWNERFYETSYDNGTVPGSATTTGMVYLGVNVSTNDVGAVKFRAPKAKDPTMSYWDGAGNSNEWSTYLGATISNNHGAIANTIASMRGAFFNLGDSGLGASGQGLIGHYAADATLVGG